MKIEYLHPEGGVSGEAFGGADTRLKQSCASPNALLDACGEYPI
jgi:hypothetical protein